MAKTQRRRETETAKAARRASERTEDDQHITEREVEDIEERSSPRTPVIYEIVRRFGEEEMARPVVSLLGSGVAAGLSRGLSLPDDLMEAARRGCRSMPTRSKATVPA